MFAVRTSSCSQLSQVLFSCKLFALPEDPGFCPANLASPELVYVPGQIT